MRVQAIANQSETEALRLSQNQVPARAKVNRSSYSLFENGHGELRKERIPIIRRLIGNGLCCRGKELRRFNVVRG